MSTPWTEEEVVWIIEDGRSLQYLFEHLSSLDQISQVEWLFWIFLISLFEC